MNLDDMLIRVHPGDGLIARFSGVVLAVLTPTPGQGPMVDELLAAAEEESGKPDGAPGRRLARRVVRLLAEAEPDDVPSFALVGQAEHGLSLILHGNADADVSTPDHQDRLSGRQVSTWVDRILEPPIDLLVVGPSAQALEPPDPRLRLSAGVVPGGGLSILPPGQGHAQVQTPPAASSRAAQAPAASPSRRAPAKAAARAETPAPAKVAKAAKAKARTPAAKARAKAEPRSAAAAAIKEVPAPPPAAVPAPPFEAPPDETVLNAAPPPRGTMGVEPEPVAASEFKAFLLTEAEPEPDDVRQPLPVAKPLEGFALDFPETDAEMVKGVICSRGHFNDPSAPFCGVCGISMVQRTLNLVDGPRPPLGVIVFDDGATFSVDSDYVLGREPESDARVTAGVARPVAVTDPERTVSRIHAALIREGWAVKVVDSGSANGTYIIPPGQQDWVALIPHQPTTIKPGTRVRLGQRVFVFDSHYGQR